MSSVSADTPKPTLLTCVHHLSPAAASIRTNRTFCVNLLRDDQSTISNAFAGHTEAKDEAKFDCATWTAGATGSLMLDGALTSFDCVVQHEIMCGSHHIFVGAVQQIAISPSEKGPNLRRPRIQQRATLGCQNLTSGVLDCGLVLSRTS